MWFSRSIATYSTLQLLDIIYRLSEKLESICEDLVNLCLTSPSLVMHDDHGGDIQTEHVSTIGGHDEFIAYDDESLVFDCGIKTTPRKSHSRTTHRNAIKI